MNRTELIDLVNAGTAPMPMQLTVMFTRRERVLLRAAAKAGLVMLYRSQGCLWVNCTKANRS